MNLGNIAPEQAHHLIYTPVGFVRVALDDSPQNCGVGLKDFPVDTLMLLHGAALNGLQERVCVQPNDHVVDEQGQRIVAGFRQSGVKGNIVFLKAVGRTDAGFRSIQCRLNSTDILISPAERGQSGTGVVVDIAVFHQLIQINGADLHQLFQRLFHRFQ